MHIIKNIVIPGGAIYGLSYYGALKLLNQENVWSIDNIETIHATSVGCIIATFIALKFEWTELDNYIINRPWQNVFKFSLYSLMNIFNENGIFDIEVLRKVFSPLFNAKEIPIDISMKDFYDVCGIELHFFTINISTFKLIDINYKSFPNWSVIESIYSSSCVPVLFKPLYKNGIGYTDGGFLENCPINRLFENNETYNENEVLCININESKILNEINEKPHMRFTLFTYLFILVSRVLKFIQKLSVEKTHNVYQVFIDQNLNPMYDMYSVVNEPEERIKLINNGIECARRYLKIGVAESD